MKSESHGGQAMPRARLRLLPFVGFALLSAPMPGMLLGQEHKHQPGPPNGKPESKQPGPTSAQLGLADLEQLALQHNPTLAMAALQVEAARGKALQAGLYP